MPSHHPPLPPRRNRRRTDPDATPRPTSRAAALAPARNLRQPAQLLPPAAARRAATQSSALPRPAARRAIAALLAFLVLAPDGHAAPDPNAADPATAIGLSEAQLLARYGYPDRRIANPDQIFLIYEDLDFSGVAPGAGVPPRLAVFTCRTIFVLDQGRVAAFHREGNACH